MLSEASKAGTIMKGHYDITGFTAGPEIEIDFL